MKIYTWENKFHNTEAKSRLNERTLMDIEYKRYLREISHAEYQQVKRLEDKLCGSRNCTCGAFNKVIS